MRTKDGNFEARIGGRVLTPYRDVLDRPDDDTTPFWSVPDTAFVRQARFEMEGTLFKDWGFKVQTDFGTGAFSQSAATLTAASVTGTLRDAFVEWKRP